MKSDSKSNQGETVLVTGASSGIGLALARGFAAEGSNLILVARNEAKLNQLAETWRNEFNVQVTVTPADLSRPAAPMDVYDQLMSQDQQVDVLVNNAGFGELGAFVDVPLERVVGMVEVNVRALTALSRLFLPQMVQRGSGGLLNVGSTASFQPGPNMGTYYATKAFVLSLTEAIAEEVRGTGVHVTCLCPGPTRTEFGDRSGMHASRVFKLGLLDADYVARAGIRGLRRNRTIVMPGVLNQLGAFWVRLLPRGVIRKVTHALNRPANNKG